MKKIFCFLIVFSLIFCGCSKKTVEDQSDASSNPSSVSTDPIETDFEKTADEIFSDRDKSGEYSTESSVTVTLSDNGSNSTSNSVKINGNTIVLSEEATYVFKGSLSNGQIVVKASDTAKVQIVLDGVNIASKTSAALCVLSCDKVFVTLAEGSENTLENGGSFEALEDNNIDGVIYSKQDITINGSGNLNIFSPAAHGIVAKDDLVITGGKIKITAASHGIDANDSISVTNSSLNITSNKDGLHAENTDDASLGYIYIEKSDFIIDAQGDGISANSTLQIESGSFNITTGGGSVNGEKQSSDSWGNMFGGGMGGGKRPGSHTQTQTETVTEDNSESIKGIKSTGGLLINGGSFVIDSADDSIHSNASIAVNNGNFEIKSGDDAFHADETLSVTSGEISVTESYEGLEGLKIAIGGGNISLVASDDGLNAAGGTDSSGMGGHRQNDRFGGMSGGTSGASNGSIVITGGVIYVNASGDGIDSNGTLSITGGEVTVCGPTMGDTAVLDYDVSGIINGGTFIGTGAANMAQSLQSSSQGVLAFRCSGQAGTSISVKDSSGKELISVTPTQSFQLVIFSSPEIKKNESYTITVGQTSGEITAS